MKTLSNSSLVALTLLLVAAAPATNFAQTESTSSVPATKISNDFGYFLEKVDSQQVVNDLRNGQWTTTVVEPGATTPTLTKEALPTGKMGWGNVKTSLALAQHSLSQQGITQPTSEQLYTSLMGGELVPGDSATMTNGILQMRSDGMGWGQIAQKYDTKLGYLMSSTKSGHQKVTATAPTTSRGIVTGSGKSASEGSVTITGKGNGKTFAGSKSQGNGIVSASGKAGGTYSSSVNHGSRGIVSGSGRAIGLTGGIVTGAGNGHQYGASSRGASHSSNAGGQGKGHSK